MEAQCSLNHRQVFFSMHFEKSDKPEHNRTVHRFGAAFTLVELLVVIGIIALLIAILLPSLGLARQAAQRTACAAKLQQIMVAATLHANEHQGYYPVVGILPGLTPAALDDAYASHYEYAPNPSLTLGVRDNRTVLPITFALATEMGYNKQVLSAVTDAQEATAETDSHGLIRHFLCPSQTSYVSDMPVGVLWASTDGDYLVDYTEALSYVFNEALLGYNDQFGRLRGRVSQIRQASLTMFAADGLGETAYLRQDDFLSDPILTFFNNQAHPPITLSDALTGRSLAGSSGPIAGDAQSFDRLRHRGKMNIAFCDGHVESRDIPVLQKDPMARSFMNIYLLAP
jgi:prepilin-type processing-associated H-X9-DG protein